MKPGLRVLAVSAPQWPARPANTKILSFTAKTPFSLQNAVRQAAGFAQNKSNAAWADSNWTTQRECQESVLLLEFMDEAQTQLQLILPNLRPSILLIGAMTLGLPGAVEIAKLARALLGEQCLIVLGGKHTNETFRQIKSDVVMLESCPLNLMKRGAISLVSNIPIFDIVFSGEGEEFITVLGEVVYGLTEENLSPRVALSRMSELKRARGSWLAGWLDQEQTSVISSIGMPLDFNIIPTAPAVFGIQSKFDIFNNVLTGHAYSDMGRGCRYNCFFCSERSEINGKLNFGNIFLDPVHRLVEHFEDIWVSGGAGNNGSVAAFVEDSILLGGHVNLIQQLIDLLRIKIEGKKLSNFQFGCQLTVSDIATLHKRNLLKPLSEVGCTYVAFGMETINEGVASKMSKHHRKGLWSDASREALSNLANSKIRSGVFVLWGIGETQLERQHQIEQLSHWKAEFGEPSAIGLNWATLHPGANSGVGNQLVANEDHEPFWATSPFENSLKRPLPNFLEWGTTEESQLLPLAVELFGEIAEKYSFYYDVKLPIKSDLEKLKEVYIEFLETSKV